jgi:predicted DNA-binding transcriptional regulator AlpA
MSNHPAELTALIGNLPDQAVLSKTQTCALTNLSEDTLNRLHRRGEGPVRVQLSPRRVGYTVGAVRSWLEKRSSE